MPMLTYKKQKLYASTKKKKAPSSKAFRRRVANDRVYVPRLNVSVSTPKIFKLSRRDAGLFTTSGAGVVNQRVHCMDPSGCSDWTQLGALYDQYKVLECWVTIYPAFSGVLESISVAYAPVVFCYDPDDTAATASFDVALQYGNHQVYNAYKTIKYAVKPIVQSDNSVSNAGMALSYRPGYGNLLDVANVANYQKGVITWYGDSLPLSQKIGEVVVDYYVQFFNRR